MAKYGQKGHLWPHIWQISQVRYPWNHRKCALCISVHHRNVEIHLGKYVYFTAHSVPTVELIMNRHGQVRSPYHPRHKDECSSKLSVQRSFEKTLIDDTVTWWNWSPLCFSFTIPNSCSGNEHHYQTMFILGFQCSPALLLLSIQPSFTTNNIISTQMQIPHQTTQCTLRAHSKNTRIGQMAMNGHIWLYGHRVRCTK